MADPFFGLRCRPGDLAVIVRDDPQCMANIGQIVRVIEKYTEFPEDWGFFWLVQPLSQQPSPVLVEDVSTRETHIEYDCGPRAHLDGWLRPLKDGTPDEPSTATQLTQDSQSLHPAQHVTAGALE